VIDQALVFLKDALNERLRQRSGAPADSADAERDVVVFIDGESLEPLSFPLGAVSALLVNVEQERLLRAGDPYHRRGPQNQPQRVKPELHLDLSMLFVARYKQYRESLRMLSEIIRFFQEWPAFLRSEHQDLPEGIAKLIIEPLTLPFAAQNEVWTALRATYQPSVLYRVRTLVFEDPQPADAPVIEPGGARAVVRHRRF
jgi:hypothetical protein